MAGLPAVTVLHVNDEESRRYLVGMRLRHAGFDVVEAESGVGALRLARDANPDVILLDIRLPDHDGLEVCRRLKADPATRAIPVVLTSAYLRDDRDRVVGLDSGAEAYLAEPVAPPVLVATLRALVRARRAEAAARDAEGTRQFLFDLLPLPAWVLDVTTLRFVAVNDAAVECLGYPRHALLDMTLTDVRADPHAEGAVIGAVEMRDESTTGIWRLRAAGGRVLDMALLVQPMPFAGREARLVVAQHAAERGPEAFAMTLERAHATLRLAVEAAAAGMLMVDERGRILLANSEAARIFGYSPVELLGAPVDRLLPERWRLAHAAHRSVFVADASRRPMGAGRELFGRRKDGAEVPVEVALNPVMTDSGLVVLATVADVTERRRAEQALRDSEERLRLAMEAGQLGTWEWIIATGEVRWSASLETIHGVQPGGFGGTYQAFEAGVHPDDRGPVAASVRAALAGGEHRLEYRIVRRDGQVRWLETRGRVFRDAEGRPIRMLGICADVTERRHAEHERARLLETEQAASRAKDEFLAMLAHELRNPLAAITSSIAILDRIGAQDDMAVRSRAIIRRQTDHLTRMMEDLLDVARVTMGKIVLALQPLDLGAAVERGVGLLTSAGRLEHHRVEVRTEPVWIAGDPVRIEQVILNLVGNAAKYTPAGGGIRITVQAEGEAAVLTVADTGIGIAPELLPRIFELFTQGERGLERAQGGLGIGLTLVKRLVEQHGGEVTAVSEGVGRGARFVVRLSRIPAPATPPPEPVVATERPAGRRRILVIEDNADARESLRTVLELAGHEVYEADSGPSGIDTALQLRPDVTFVDIGLPGVDGYEVARRLRASAETRLRLVALSGYGQPDDRRRADEAGFDAHLVKPVHPAVLLRVIAGQRA
jgi:two-component system CheB/CheR fusion protein